MADQKKKLNGKALTGFMLVILSPVFIAVLMGCYRLISNVATASIVNLILIILAILVPVSGRIFSVIGLIMSIIKKEKGKKLAIAAIVISELEFIAYFVFALFWVFMAIYGDSRPPVPPAH
ncbi:MAG: hypothetical protein K5869_00505 [Saccharofermentans sp.]|nr:hypothetical protein [Saccharofermentans sp.]